MVSDAACQVLTVAMLVSWCLITASGLYDLGAGLRREKRRWVLLLIALFVVAASLRVWLAIWSAGNGQFRYQFIEVGRARPLDAACRPDLGAAPDALWGGVGLLLPTFSEEVVILGTLLMGSLAPVLLTLFADLVGFGRFGAMAAGALLALHPVAIRWSGTMVRPGIVLFLATLAMWSFARARPFKSVRALVVFALAAWLCARTRPEAGLVFALVGVAFLAFRLDTERWHRDAWNRLEAAFLFVAGALSVAHLVWMSQYNPAVGSILSGIWDKSWLAAFTPARAIWVDRGYTSLGAIALFGVGVAAGLVWARRAVLWAIACLVLVVLAGPPEESWELMIVYTRYQALPLLLFCSTAGVGAGLVARLFERFLGSRAPPLVGAALLAALVGTSTEQLSKVCRPVTIDHEYHFLKEALHQLPACAVVYRPFDPDNDVSGGMRDIDKLSRWLGRAAWRGWPLGEPAGACPTYFYRSPLCYVKKTRGYGQWVYPGYAVVAERCREGLARSEAYPALTTEVPAIRWGPETYDRERLTIGFYELRHGTGGSGAP